jgi:hypothetical protein
VTDGLVLYLDAANRKSYPGTGTGWFDLSGKNNNGILINGPTYNSGNNGIIDFDGSNDQVSLKTATELNIDSVTLPFTISIWFKTTQSGERYIFDNLDDFTPNVNISFRLDNGAIEIYLLATTGSGLYQYGSNYNNDAWHNAVLTWSGSSQVQRVYVDRILLGSNTLSLSGSFETNSVFLLGTRPYGGGIFQGSLGPVSVYNKELNAQEIQQNFNALRGRFGI